MNKEQKQKLILDIANFYMLFEKEILDLFPESNDSELSPLLFKALHEIHLHEDITPSILSKRLSIPISNTSRFLHKLTEMSYIVKTKDPIDKRIIHIELSEKGLKLVRNSLEITNTVLLSKMDVLNTDELTQLSEAFIVLIDLFEKIRILNLAK